MKTSTYSIIGTAVMLMAVSSAGLAATTNYRVVDPLYILDGCHPNVAKTSLIITLPNSPQLLSAGTTTATIAGAPSSSMKLIGGTQTYTITNGVGNSGNAFGFMTNAGLVKVVNGVTTIHVTLTPGAGTTLTANLNLAGPMGNVLPNIVVWASLSNIRDAATGLLPTCPQ